MKETRDVNWGMHLLELEITYRCNLNCLHCYNRHEKIMDMEYVHIIELIEVAACYGLQRLVITGGEAALHPDFEKICEYIRKNRERFQKIKSIVLQSNGYIKNVSDEVLKTFDIIHLSYDIENSNTRDLHLNTQLECAKRIQQLGIYTYFFATVSQENKNSINEMTEIANANGIPIVFNLCTLVDGRNEELLLDKDEHELILRKIMNLENEGKIRPFKHPYSAVLKGHTSDTYIGNRAGCTAGIASLVIKANGKAIPCPFLRTECGDVLRDGLYRVWNCSKQLDVLRNRKMFSKCGDCKFVSYCGGCRKNAFEFTNRLDGEDPNCLLSN